MPSADTTLTSSDQLDARLRAVERDVQRVLSVVCTPPPTPAYLGDGLVFLPTSLGFPLIGFADDLQVTAALLMQRRWDVPTTQLLERILRPGDAFLDVGANIGYFTVFASMLVGFHGRVHAFEPNPRTHDLLARNVRLNTVGHVVTLHARALADAAGTRTLHTFVHNQGGSTLAQLPDRLLAEWHERPADREVAVTTLDATFAGSGVTFACVKLDAEGSEELIWRGGERFFADCVDARTIVLLEWNPPALGGLGVDREAFMARITNAGFSVWRRDDHLVATPVRTAAELDDWRISELLLARDPARIRTVCP